MRDITNLTLFIALIFLLLNCEDKVESKPIEFKKVDKATLVEIPEDKTLANISKVKTITIKKSLKDNTKYSYYNGAKEIFRGKGFDKAFPFFEGYALVGKRKENSGLMYDYTFISESGIEISDYKYYKLSQFVDGYALFQKDKKKLYGVIDVNGKEIIPPVLHSTYIFHDGLLLISDRPEPGYISSSTEIKYGYINLKGDTVIPLKYDRAGDFGNGMAPVKIGGKYQFIDKQGKVKIQKKFSEAYPFVNGMAAVKENGKLGFIDTLGNYIIKPQYSDFENIIENMGYDFIEIKKTQYLNDSNYLIVSKNYKWGIIDTSNTIKIPFKYSNIEHFAGDILKVRIYKNEKSSYGLMNFNTLKIILDLKYSLISGLSVVNQLNWINLIVENSNGDELEGKYNCNTKVLIPAEYDEMSIFFDGICAVKRNDKWAFMDENGKLITIFKFDESTIFINGKATVKENGKYYSIDKFGRRIK